MLKNIAHLIWFIIAVGLVFYDKIPPMPTNLILGVVLLMFILVDMINDKIDRGITVTLCLKEKLKNE